MLLNQQNLCTNLIQDFARRTSSTVLHVARLLYDCYNQYPN